MMDGIEGPGAPYRLVARTQSIEEADRIAGQYEREGFETKIVKREQGTIAVFEVWVTKKPDIFSQRM